jgi:hypothetical protein
MICFLTPDAAMNIQTPFKHDNHNYLDMYWGKSVTLKKRKQIFLIYKEIHMGSVAKSHMRKGFPVYEEMRK